MFIPISLNTYLNLRKYLNPILSKGSLLYWKIGEKLYMDLLGVFSNSMTSAIKTQ